LFLYTSPCLLLLTLCTRCGPCLRYAPLNAPARWMQRVALHRVQGSSREGSYYVLLLWGRSLNRGLLNFTTMQSAAQIPRSKERTHFSPSLDVLLPGTAWCIPSRCFSGTLTVPGVAAGLAGCHQLFSEEGSHAAFRPEAASSALFCSSHRQSPLQLVGAVHV